MATKVDLDALIPYLRILIYGPAGSYKTRTASTAALDERLAPCLMLDASGNPISIRDYVRRPDIIRVADLKDYNDPYDWIVGGQKETHPLVKDFGLTPGYRTLIIDQVTETQRMYFRQVMGRKSRPGDVVIKREWEHYNKVLYSMIDFVKLYYDLPINVIMVAQEREGDPDRGRMIGPYLEGEGQAEICAYAEMIIRMSNVYELEPIQLKTLAGLGYKPEEIQSVAFFEGRGKFYAKNQYGGSLGSFMVNPTLTRIVDAISGTKPTAQ